MNKCMFCNKEFEPYHSNQRYCSKDCRNKDYYQNNSDIFLKAAKKYSQTTKGRLSQWRTNQKRKYEFMSETTIATIIKNRDEKYGKVNGIITKFYWRKKHGTKV